MMSTETTPNMNTEQLAEAYSAAWDANDLDAILALQGDDMVFHLHVAGFEQANGPAAVREHFALLFAAFDELVFAPQAAHVAGDLIITRYRLQGALAAPLTVAGELLEPNGRRFDIDGADIITAADGLVRSKHTYLDVVALREQLGG